MSRSNTNAHQTRPPCSAAWPIAAFRAVLSSRADRGGTRPGSRCRRRTDDRCSCAPFSTSGRLRLSDGRRRAGRARIVSVPGGPYNSRFWRVIRMQSELASNLTNHFLLAMPGMADAELRRHVVFIAEHSAKGALGLVINRPMELDLAHAVRAHRPESRDRADWASSPVFYGGPVQTDRGFVLHQPLGGLELHRGGRRRHRAHLVEGRARGGGRRPRPRRMLVTLGYSGWGPGQLEDEIARNAWLTVPADPDAGVRHAGRAARWRAPSACSASTRRSCPPRRGMPEGDAGGTRASPRRAMLAGAADGARFRFRRAAHRRRGRQLADRLGRPLAHDRGANPARPRFGAIAALIAEWQPQRLVVGRPAAPRRQSARDDRALRALRAPAARALTACRSNWSTSVIPASRHAPTWMPAPGASAAARRRRGGGDNPATILR